MREFLAELPWRSAPPARLCTLLPRLEDSPVTRILLGREDTGEADARAA